MIINASRSSKQSKDAKAERILQVLSQKNKPSISGSSKKIRKRKRGPVEDSQTLRFRTRNDQRRHVHWVYPRPRTGYKMAPRGTPNEFPTTGKRTRKKGAGQRSKAAKNSVPQANQSKEQNVNYAALFASAYAGIKSESSICKSQRRSARESDQKTVKSGSQAVSNDSFSGIEYDPFDNFFYLVSHQNALKKALFENKAISKTVQTPCLVINPRVVESLKKSFALESFLC